MVEKKCSSCNTNNQENSKFCKTCGKSFEITNTSEKENNLDIATDSVLSKWPRWLRWVLFFPASVLAAIIIPVIVAIIGGFTTGGENPSIWGSIVSSAVFGYVFVYVAAYVAPKHQFIVGMVNLVLLTFISVGLVLLVIITGNLSGSAWLTMLYLCIEFGAGIAAIVLVKNQLDEK